MKKLLLCLALVTLSGCNNFSKSSAADKCTAKPEGVLTAKTTRITLPRNQFIKLGDRAVSNEYIGYTFQANSGQKLSYKTADSICTWVYTPDNQILPRNAASLPTTGEYTLKVAALKGSSSNFSLKLGLDIPESWEWLMDKVLTPTGVNIVTSFVLGFFGWTKFKSLKEIIEDKKVDKEYADLKKFFIPEFKNNHSSKPAYKIIYFGDSHNSENQNHHIIQHTLLLAIYKLSRFLEKISNQEIIFERIKVGEKIKRDMFFNNDDNHIIIIGLKYGLQNYYKDFYTALGIATDFNHRNKNSCSSIVLRINHPYKNDKFITILDDISGGLGILGATKLITTPKQEDREENINVRLREHFLEAVNKPNNPNIVLYLGIKIDNAIRYTEIVSPKVINVKLNEDINPDIGLTRETIIYALNIICS